MVIILISSYILLTSLLIFGTNKLKCLYLNNYKPTWSGLDTKSNCIVKKMDTQLSHHRITDKDWGWYIDIDIDNDNDN